jgi:hypothetical protein
MFRRPARPCCPEFPKAFVSVCRLSPCVPDLDFGLTLTDFYKASGIHPGDLAAMARVLLVGFVG